jgi:hypothetical protein
MERKMRAIGSTPLSNEHRELAGIIGTTDNVTWTSWLRPRRPKRTEIAGLSTQDIAGAVIDTLPYL